MAASAPNSFSAFLAAFPIDEGRRPTGHGPAATDLETLRATLGGLSFARGLYRIHDAKDSDYAAARIEAYYPEPGRYLPFGCDWLGRGFTLDLARKNDDEPLVMLLEPGTGERLEIPATLRAFHNEELVEQPEAALAAGFYADWLRSGGRTPRAHECIGYRVPLFLGGADSIENLEAIDTDVYWTILAQLRHGTRSISHGQTIGEVRIELG